MLIGLWITTGCNLKCKYCYEGEEKQFDNMSIDVAEQTIDFIKHHYTTLEHEPLVIEFHGGEPLLNYDLIPYIVKRMEESFENILFGITTNGILLNESKITYLSKKMTYGLSLSVDGERQSHDKNRVDNLGSGTYDSVIMQIPQLLSKCENIRARMTYTPQTIDHLSDNIIHLIDLGFKNIVSVPDYFSENWSQNEMEILLTEMQKTKRYYETNNLEKNDVNISILENFFKEKGVCQGGKSNFHIMPNGDIYPCSYGTKNDELKLGNVSNSELIVSKLEKLEEINNSFNSACEGCDGYISCICSRCKIFNKVLTGDFLQPVPIICAIEHIKHKYVKNSK